MPDYSQRRTTMVDTQVRPSDVTKYPVLDAMLTVKRELFVPSAMSDLAYMDGPINLSASRQLLDPRTTAKLLEGLAPSPDDLVLEIGTGLGYTAALLARLSQAVVTVEEDEALASEAESVLGSEGVDNVAVVTAPLNEGSSKHGPFDVIVAFSGVEQMPESLLEQLRDGGRIAAIFMDGPVGRARLGKKSGGVVSWRDMFNCTAPILPGFEAPKEFFF